MSATEAKTAAVPAAPARWSLGADRDWIAVMAAVTALELTWWIVAWSVGIAPLPSLSVYAGATAAALCMALAGKRLSGNGSVLPTRAALLAATILVALGASLFLPLKYAIPSEVPFWLDRPLALGERSLFGIDPWLILDRFIGWADVPIDRLYATWLPVQLLALFAVVIQPPSVAKSRALIAYVLAWFILGAVAAVAFASAGPIFYERLYGGGEFAAIRQDLLDRGATMVVTETDAIWASYESGRPTLVAGMSAVPSLHVAISLWMMLAARDLCPRLVPAALAYVTFVWVASVQLGWHYAADGAAGALGLVILWPLAERLRQRVASSVIPALPQDRELSSVGVPRR